MAFAIARPIAIGTPLPMTDLLPCMVNGISAVKSRGSPIASQASSMGRTLPIPGNGPPPFSLLRTLAPLDATRASATTERRPWGRAPPLPFAPAPLADSRVGQDARAPLLLVGDAGIAA